MQSQFTLDNLNRVTSLNNAKLIYEYTLDAAGNRRQVVEHLPNETGRTVNWSYDNIYRLTDEVITLDPHSRNGNAHYDLDPVGNRTQETATLPGLLPGTFTYDPTTASTPKPTTPTATRSPAAARPSPTISRTA